MFAAAPWIIDAAPYESTMGLVYKIYFFHMPSAWMFLLAAIVSGVASARFLFMKKASADGWALAAAELAVLFGALHAGRLDRSGRERPGASGGCGTRGSRRASCCS